MAEITAAEVEQAAAAFLAMKRKAQARSAAAPEKKAYKDAAASFAALRTAYRVQEEKAGRRGGLAGGDLKEEG